MERFDGESEREIEEKKRKRRREIGRLRARSWGCNLCLCMTRIDGVAGGRYPTLPPTLCSHFTLNTPEDLVGMERGVTILTPRTPTPPRRRKLEFWVMVSRVGNGKRRERDGKQKTETLPKKGGRGKTENPRGFQ